MRGAIVWQCGAEGDWKDDRKRRRIHRELDHCRHPWGRHLVDGYRGGQFGLGPRRGDDCAHVGSQHSHVFAALATVHAVPGGAYAQGARGPSHGHGASAAAEVGRLDGPFEPAVWYCHDVWPLHLHDRQGARHVFPPRPVVLTNLDIDRKLFHHIALPSVREEIRQLADPGVDQLRYNLGDLHHTFSLDGEPGCRGVAATREPIRVYFQHLKCRRHHQQSVYIWFRFDIAIYPC
mmetsp:Transcript_6744/g.20096  ORF Transcript_6744/g.20096 Transcript_6744/m.20096 type:complete len:234 (-) Transcript_6744:527-1228(-)